MAREREAVPAAGRRPLYFGTGDARLISTTVGNAGLWYDKFCDRWNAAWDGLGDTGKRDWIAAVANLDGTSAKRVGDAELLREAVQRQKVLTDRRGGKLFCLTTAWRLISGLGRSHPVENGFAWHHGLGTPYLPGSSVKGVARAWAVWNSCPDIERLFGPKAGSAAALHAGSVIFLDALPVAPVALDADVMTPHYAPWYREGEAPGDWYSPTPIPFLAVAPHQTFQFALLPRTPADADDCAAAETLLREALETLGAGAKTAAGYGVFADESTACTGSSAKCDMPSTSKPAPWATPPRRVGSRVRVTEYQELGTVIKVLEDTLLVVLDSEDDPIEMKISKVEWL